MFGPGTSQVCPRLLAGGGEASAQGFTAQLAQQLLVYTQAFMPQQHEYLRRIGSFLPKQQMGTSGLEQGLGLGNIQHSCMAGKYLETKMGWLQKWKVRIDVFHAWPLSLLAIASNRLFSYIM